MLGKPLYLKRLAPYNINIIALLSVWFGAVDRIASDESDEIPITTF